MSSAVKNMMIRVIGRRMAAGESFSNIIKSYPKLTKADIAEIKQILSKGGTEHG